MAEALVEFVPYFGQPGTSNGTLFTVPANHNYIVSSITLANTTGSAATITLARNGTAATAANQFIPGVSLNANSVTTLTGPWPFVAADTLQGLQGTSGAITVYLGGADHTLT